MAFVAALGLVALPVQHGTTTGTMRGGTAYYLPAGTTQEKPVVSWFHSSGRDKLHDGDTVSVILYPDGGHASSKSPYLLAFYTILGGMAAIGVGYVMVRFA